MIKKFQSIYPTKEELKEFLVNSKDLDIECFIQQWLSEGPPHAFKGDPFLFENFRIKLAKQLMINAKEITMIGSARLGYSLKPKYYGREFSSTSDLDLAIISDKLFNNCSKDNSTWMREYDSNKIKPKNTVESNFWKDNYIINSYNLKNGFIDINKIPSYRNYTTIFLIRNSIFYFTSFLCNNNDGIIFSKITIRVYKDWHYFIKQNNLNLSLLKDELIKGIKL
jgi:hypothetical protein